MRIGDINKKSFEEVWFGNQRKEVMEKLDPKNIVVFIVFEMDQINI